MNKKTNEYFIVLFSIQLMSFHSGCVIGNVCESIMHEFYVRDMYNIYVQSYIRYLHIKYRMKKF